MSAYPDAMFQVHDDVEREIDGMWFAGSIVSIDRVSGAYTYNVQFEDIGNTEKGVPERELRLNITGGQQEPDNTEERSVGYVVNESESKLGSGKNSQKEDEAGRPDSPPSAGIGVIDMELPPDAQDQTSSVTIHSVDDRSIAAARVSSFSLSYSADV